MNTSRFIDAFCRFNHRERVTPPRPAKLLRILKRKVVCRHPQCGTTGKLRNVDRRKNYPPVWFDHLSLLTKRKDTKVREECTVKDDGAPRLTVLVIEDEPLIAMMLEDMIQDAGHLMAGPCTTTKAADEALAQESFDVALVDLTLSDGSTASVIKALAERGIPFAIMSGQSGGELEGHANAILSKPFNFEELGVVLRRLSECVPTNSLNFSTADGATKRFSFPLQR